MCWLSKLFKGEKPDPPATMTAAEVIEKLEEDILIHEQWAVIVTQHPQYAETMGDYDWHLAWNEVYRNAIYYIKRQLEVQNKWP